MCEGRLYIVYILIQRTSKQVKTKHAKLPKFESKLICLHANEERERGRWYMV